MSSHSRLRDVLRDLIEAVRDNALADCQDGGVNVDVVNSMRKGHESEVMSLKEAEQRLDRALRNAWKEITGDRIKGDPVEFILCGPHPKVKAVPATGKVGA